MTFIVEVYKSEDGTLIRTEEFKTLKEIEHKYKITYHTIRTILDDKYLKKRNIQTYLSTVVKTFKIKTKPLEILNIE
jgi:hypothetical protein